VSEENEDLPRLTGNRLVAYNLARIRRERGLTASQAADLMFPFLEQQWSNSTFSVAERSYSHETRVRQFTADDLVALSMAFRVPPGYFLLPPAERIHDPMDLGFLAEDWLAMVLDAEGQLLDDFRRIAEQVVRSGHVLGTETPRLLRSARLERDYVAAVANEFEQHGEALVAAARELARFAASQQVTSEKDD
jgi:hypothetical protein